MASGRRSRSTPLTRIWWVVSSSSATVRSAIRSTGRSSKTNCPNRALCRTPVYRIFRTTTTLSKYSFAFEKGMPFFRLWPRHALQTLRALLTIKLVSDLSLFCNPLRRLWNIEFDIYFCLKWNQNQENKYLFISDYYWLKAWKTTIRVVSRQSSVAPTFFAI